MTIDIRPIDPVNRSFFAGVVSGLDLSRPLSPQEVAAVHAGMDQFGVLVFHDQKIDDDQQLVFSRSLGPLEQATGDIAAPEERRMSMDLNDISNLDKNNRILARDDRRRLFGLGNQLWHSDSSFKPVPAKYSLLSAVPRLLAGEAVTTIAFDLDYSSPAAFTTMFRQLVGASPTAYRRAAA